MALHLVKMACERPDLLGRSLSQWDCMELARQLVAEGIVTAISSETVRRILAHHQLKPCVKGNRKCTYLGKQIFTHPRGYSSPTGEIGFSRPAFCFSRSR